MHRLRLYHYIKGLFLSKNFFLPLSDSSATTVRVSVPESWSGGDVSTWWSRDMTYPVSFTHRKVRILLLNLPFTVFIYISRYEGPFVRYL